MEGRGDYSLRLRNRLGAKRERERNEKNSVRTKREESCLGISVHVEGRGESLQTFKFEAQEKN